MEKGHVIKVLDHGYLRLVDWMGGDEDIIEAARQSTGRGFEGWEPGEICKHCRVRKETFDSASFTPPGFLVCAEGRPQHEWEKTKGDMSFLERLYRDEHATPFEAVELKIQVQAPIMVFREWHRHRTQCLSGSTLIHFDLPSPTKKGHRRPYKLSMEQLWKRWQPTTRANRKQRQVNALWPRTRIQAMRTRCLDESTGNIVYTHIVDVIRSEAKPIYEITVTSGKIIKASADHRFYTDRGWLRLAEFVDLAALDELGNSGPVRTTAQPTVTTTARDFANSWDPPALDEREEGWKVVVGWDRYEVSNMGRVRRSDTKVIKKATVSKGTGYLVVSLNRPGLQAVRTVHSLVLESFIGPCPVGKEARHENHNRADARLSNLCWGLPIENHRDMQSADRQVRLCSRVEEIVNVKKRPPEVTYDLEVRGPWHNFVADGFIVHNSYNEMSARYIQMPDLHYLPEPGRVQLQSKSNKQGSAEAIPAAEANDVIAELERQQVDIYEFYDGLVDRGIAKEVARINTPISRYSRMMAKTSLRNWLHFTNLRKAISAQWEIRQYAEALAEVLSALFPRSWYLFEEYTFYAKKLSRTQHKTARSHIESLINIARTRGDDSVALIKAWDELAAMGLCEKAAWQ